MLTKGGPRSSGLDADGWRRILTSREFGNSLSDLRKTFTNFAQKIYNSHSPSKLSQPTD